VLAPRGTEVDGTLDVLAGFGVLADEPPPFVAPPPEPLLAGELAGGAFFQHPGNARSGRTPPTITPAVNPARHHRFSFMTYLRSSFRRPGQSYEPTRCSASTGAERPDGASIP
jgi:hypothetical protein